MPLWPGPASSADRSCWASGARPIVIIAIAAAAITPTIDPINMAIVMGPLILLYLGSVGLAYLLYRPRVPRDFSEENFIPDEFRDEDE